MKSGVMPENSMEATNGENSGKYSEMTNNNCSVTPLIDMYRGDNLFKLQPDENHLKQGDVHQQTVSSFRISANRMRYIIIII